EEVSGAALLALNDRMVQQLVKKIGHQAVLMDLINKYKQQKQGLQSFVYVCEPGSPTLPEISGYPNSQQYNVVVGALMQAYPFLNEDGNGFLVWKRALKDRFKYVRRAIEDDEQVLKNKCKFGHRKGQSRKSSCAENKPYDIKVHKEDLADYTQSPSALVVRLAKADEDELEPRSQLCFLLQSTRVLGEAGLLLNTREEPAYLDNAMNVHIINWLKEEYTKTLRNWKEVNNKMNATLKIRRKMICDKTPLKDILRLFPFLRCPYQVTVLYLLMALIYTIDMTQLWMLMDVSAQVLISIALFNMLLH
ncbi:hypothetical protein ASZ78_015974, partial [Callipepla squamata]